MEIRDARTPSVARRPPRAAQVTNDRTSAREKSREQRTPRLKHVIRIDNRHIVCVGKRVRIQLRDLLSEIVVPVFVANADPDASAIGNVIATQPVQTGWRHDDNDVPAALNVSPDRTQTVRQPPKIPKIRSNQDVDRRRHSSTSPPPRSPSSGPGVPGGTPPGGRLATRSIKPASTAAYRSSSWR